MYDLLLLDGLNVLHRAGFSFDLGYWEDSDYHQTGATFGFLQIAMAFYKKHANPGAELVVCWDAGYDHRLELYPDYKISRRKPVSPDDKEAQESKRQHRFQRDLLREIMALAGWRSARAAGFEADDVLATLAVQGAAQGKTVALCTTDQDLHQVVSERVHVLSSGPRGEKRWDPKAVEEKWGFPPSRVAELKALMGDGGDDIPGCPGCGLGSARKFLQQYGTIEAVLDASSQGPLTGEYLGKPWKAKALAVKMASNAELVRVSHELAKVVTDAPVVISGPVADPKRLRQRLSAVAFHSLLSKDWDRLLSLGVGSPPAPDLSDTLDMFL